MELERETEHHRENDTGSESQQQSPPHLSVVT